MNIESKVVSSLPSMNETYPEFVKFCMETGEQMRPRGMACRELRPFGVFLDPTTALYTGNDRRLNYCFYAVETLGYVAGLDERWYADLLCAANPNMSKWQNSETGKFDGAYGPRLCKSMPRIVDMLKDDPHTRQAVASIWSPGIPEGSLDVPCTLNLQFITSNGRLNLIVTMRSNDLNWGFPYDVASFSAIQLIVANAIGMPPGVYIHHTGSMHLYEDTPPKLSGACSYVDGLYVPKPSSDAATYASYVSGAYDLLWSLRRYYDRTGDLRSFSDHKFVFSDYWSQWMKLISFRWSGYEG